VERLDDEAVRALLARMERPLDGLERITELRLTLTRIERLLVREARLNFNSWEQIGAALGISRQAAHRRHRPFVSRTSGL
jgi:hypothetical protein